MRTSLITLLVVLLELSGRAGAQSTGESAEVAVNGPPGALLFVDKKLVGALPLRDNLTLAAGEHRFGLEHGNQKAESDPLRLPPSRQSELNLTLAGRHLVAVLSITPAVLLILELRNLAEALRPRVTQALAAAVKQEHAVLLEHDPQAANSGPSASAIGRCLEGDCHDPLLYQQGQSGASYVLSVRLDNEGRAVQVRTTLLDLRTRDIGARAEQRCLACNQDSVIEQLSNQTKRLLADTVLRRSGVLVVTTSPPGASVLLDGRWLGVTPCEQESFVGSRTVELKKEGFQPERQEVAIESGETTTVQRVLQHAPVPPHEKRARPAWRLATGGILVGGGLVVMGLGASAVAQDGKCWVYSDNVGTCTPYFDTLPIGAGLLGGGSALVVGGTLLLAIPARPGESVRSMSGIPGSGPHASSP